MSPEDQRALVAARAQTAALYEERRRMAAERRRMLGVANEAGAASTRRSPWPLVLSMAVMLLVAAGVVLIGQH